MEIGVIGFSTQSFDVRKAKRLLDEALAYYYGREDVVISSGLTNLGVPAIAYELASKNGLKTKGVACAKAHKYEKYYCDTTLIVGAEWGDESLVFLDGLDILIRVGGGKQSFSELAAAKKMGIQCIEINL